MVDGSEEDGSRDDWRVSGPELFDAWSISTASHLFLLPPARNASVNRDPSLMYQPLSAAALLSASDDVLSLLL